MPHAQQSMSGNVFFLMLFGALLSAIWNAIVKSGSDKFLHAVLVANGAGLVAVILLPFLPQPAHEAWLYIGASAVLQVVYFKFLAAAFRAGDISHAYPLMRGGAPLLVALVSGPLIGEALSFGKWSGVLLVCSGVMGLAWEGRRHNSAHGAVLRYGLANALIIASYTVVDGIGVRASEASAAYTLWNVLLTGLILLVWTVSTRPKEFFGYAQGRLRITLVGGVATVSAYGIVLWAMTQASIAAVAALRETSMIFVLVIAVLFLNERVSARRCAATALIVCGAILIRVF
jgi:drug/metabolite transporter (DMT)-like permease